MKKRWIIGIAAALTIWIAGAAGFFVIKAYVPTQLNTPSSILANAAPDLNKKPATAEEKSIKEILNESQPLVVQIELEDGSYGSGFLYNNKGDFITNAHVVAGAKEVIVWTADQKEYRGTVIGISNVTDVAVVRVEEFEGKEPLKISTNSQAEVGDEVIALGNPLGLQNTVTTGIISGLERDLEIYPYKYIDVYQISAPIAPGNSGGPLINRNSGEVIGINSAAADVGTIGFSIPIGSVIGLIEGWSEKPMTELPINQEQFENYSYNDGTYTDEETAIYVVSYFYDSINYNDYITAYSLLGSELQSNTEYTDFRNEYLKTASVYIDDMKTTPGEEPIVTANITKEEWLDGEYQYTRYSVTFTIGVENGKMKIINMHQEEIKN